MSDRDKDSGTDGANFARQLAEELKAMKSASGLSFISISERTHYAKSSWERWVNGKQLPPRDALKDLARLCSRDAADILRLRDQADAARAAASAARPTAKARSAARPGDALPSPGTGGSVGGCCADADALRAYADAERARADVMASALEAIAVNGYTATEAAVPWETARDAHLARLGGGWSRVA